jgi:hypothetical protein
MTPVHYDHGSTYTHNGLEGHVLDSSVAPLGRSFRAGVDVPSVSLRDAAAWRGHESDRGLRKT